MCIYIIEKENKLVVPATGEALDLVSRHRSGIKSLMAILLWLNL